MVSFWYQLRRFVSQITVEPVLFFYMFAIFMETNALQSLFFTKVCLQLGHPTNECSYEPNSNLTSVVAAASTWIKYYDGCMGFCTVLMSLYIASWSDKLGRKIPMLIPVVGTLISSSVNAILSMYIDIHLAYFLITAVISGITFGMVAVIAATFGFLSDIVSEEERTKRIVILEAMIFVGGTAGMYVTGALLHGACLNGFFNDYVKVFVLEMAIALLILFYIIGRIPLRLHSDTTGDISMFSSNQNVSCHQLFSLNHIKDALQTLFKRRDNGKRKHILLLLFALCFVYFGSSVKFTVSFLFVKNAPLHWDITRYSNYSSLQFALQGVALLVILPLVFHVLCVQDLVISIIGVTSRLAGLVLFGFSRTVTMVYSSAVLSMFSEFCVPTVRSALSKLVEENEKGKIFALTTVLQTICYFLAAFIFPTVFRSSLKFFPGLCFEVVAALQGISLVTFCYLHYSRRRVISAYNFFENDDGCAEGRSDKDEISER